MHWHIHRFEALNEEKAAEAAFALPLIRELCSAESAAARAWQILRRDRRACTTTAPAVNSLSNV